MRSKWIVVVLLMFAATAIVPPANVQAAGQGQRGAVQRRPVPRRQPLPPGYYAVPRPYHFAPVDITVGFYYHPYFGFYYGPYYGPFYPYPGPYYGPVAYSASALRTKVKPVETEVWVNGYYAGIVDDFDGIFQRLYLPAGEHTIELRLEGYRGFSQNVYLGLGDTFDVEHLMVPLGPGEVMGPPPAPGELPEEWTKAQAELDLSEGDFRPASPFGILSIRVQPEGAEVLVDGHPWPATTAGSGIVLHLSAGPHRIEIRKQGYETFAAEIELVEGQMTPLNVRLASR